MEELQKKIKYEFKNKNLLKRALTHSSYANENPGEGKSNERMEFLGDSILSLVTTEYLFRHFSHLPEGELTKIRAALVCEDALFEYTKAIDLGEYLLLGKGELNSNGRRRPSTQADAFEALIAAIYLDSGMAEVSEFVLGFITKTVDSDKVAFHDYKTTLQEIVQKNRGEILEYALVKEEGPDHAKQFEVQVKLNSNIIGTGTGKSKKQAEQEAAKQALELMGI